LPGISQHDPEKWDRFSDKIMLNEDQETLHV